MILAVSHNASPPSNSSLDCAVKQSIAQAFASICYFLPESPVFGGPRNVRTLRLNVSKSRVSHSQMTSTFHFDAFSARIFRLSRALLAANFLHQKIDRTLGVVVFEQPLCRCQNQPWINSTLCRLGKTRSGLPGKSRRWRRKRYARECTTRRTIISGFVFLLRTLDIRRLRSTVTCGSRILKLSLATCRSSLLARSANCQFGDSIFVRG